MRPRRATASSIGMLWIEMTPNAVVTPQRSKKAATTSPTVARSGGTRSDTLGDQRPRGGRRSTTRGRGAEQGRDRACRLADEILDLTVEPAQIERRIDRRDVDRGDRPAGAVAHRRRHRAHAALEEGGADRIATPPVLGEQRAERR